MFIDLPQPPGYREALLDEDTYLRMNEYVGTLPEGNLYDRLATVDVSKLPKGITPMVLTQYVLDGEIENSRTWMERRRKSFDGMPAVEAVMVMPQKVFMSAVKYCARREKSRND